MVYLYICTATLKPAKDTDFVNDNIPITSFAIDHKKLRDLNKKVMKTFQVEHNKIIMEEDIQLILFHERKENTKTIVFGEDSKLHPIEIKEFLCLF